MAGLKGNARASALIAGQTQVYASQGIGSPAGDLPRKFQARNQQTDAAPGLVPLFRPSDHLALVPGMPSAVVRRWPRMVGMRYLYGTGHRKMEVTRDAAGGTAYPFISAFQRMWHGPIFNGGFNDALYQAGYPGFNLGLSFGVETPQPPNIQSTGVQPNVISVGSPGSRVASYPPIFRRPSYRELNR